jgi:hypothetical protein
VFIKEVDRLPGGMDGRTSDNVTELGSGADGMPYIFGERGFLEEQNVVAI